MMGAIGCPSTEAGGAGCRRPEVGELHVAVERTLIGRAPEPDAPARVFRGAERHPQTDCCAIMHFEVQARFHALHYEDQSEGAAERVL